MTLRRAFGAGLPLALVLSATAATAQETAVRPPDARPAVDPRAELAAPRKPASVRGPFVLTSVGDILLPRAIGGAADAELDKVVALLRGDDVTIGNQEGVFFDHARTPGVGHGVGLLIGDPGAAEAEKAMGVQMVSLANNHAMEWGEAAERQMLALLDAAGIPYAGYGATREDAYRGAFLATPKGRVGLVGTASTFKTDADALDATAFTPPRPGIAVIRTRTVEQVTPEALAQLAAFVKASGRGRVVEGEVTLDGQRFRAAPSPSAPALHYEMNLYDHAALLRGIRSAKAQADLVVLNIHAHETPSGVQDKGDDGVADFLPRLFHDAIDAGADAAMAGGPHELRGIEIYKGKPLFYGLGAVVFRGDRRWLPDALQANAYPGTPPERYGSPGQYAADSFRPSDFDGVIAQSVFDGDRVREVRLYPLDLGRTDDWRRRGVPHLADPSNARRILQALQRKSAPFGTVIEIDGAVGRIRLP